MGYAHRRYASGVCFAEVEHPNSTQTGQVQYKTTPILKRSVYAIYAYIGVVWGVKVGWEWGGTSSRIAWWHLRFTIAAYRVPVN